MVVFANRILQSYRYIDSEFLTCKRLEVASLQDIFLEKEPPKSLLTIAHVLPMKLVCYSLL